MSLKNFHIVFILAATVLALFCAAQAFGEFRRVGSPLMALSAAAGLLAAGALIRYETLFLRRCREAGIR